MKKPLSLLLSVVILLSLMSVGAAEKVTLTLLIDNNSPISAIEAVAAKIEEELGIGTEIDIRPSSTEGESVIRTHGCGRNG